MTLMNVTAVIVEYDVRIIWENLHQLGRLEIAAFFLLLLLL